LHASNKLPWVEFTKSVQLIHYLRSIWSVVLIVIFFGMLSESQAADSIGIASTSAIRMQLQSIADEVIGQAKLDPKYQVVLHVEGEGPQSLAENAFVETFQKQNYTLVLSAGKASEQALEVFLLSTNIKLQTVDTKYSERNIRIALEARTVVGKERKVHLLGTFHREVKDTAQIFPSIQLLGAQVDEGEENLMQKLLAPFIVLSGAILIVYLLFTVRN
jgi:hypothetical protein